MIDFIKFVAPIPDFERWRSNTDIEFFTDIDQYTGSLKCTARNDNLYFYHRGKFREYDITVTQIQSGLKNSYKLTCKGSIHQNIQIEDNFSPYSFAELNLEIMELARHLKLDLTACVIRNIEIGISILFPEPVFSYLNGNLLFYSDFTEREDFKVLSGKKRIGFQFRKSDYRFKIYDTAAKHNLPHTNHWMKLELHYNTMRQPNLFGIKTLYDLTRIERVGGLVDLLVKSWGKTFVSDNSLETIKLGKINQRIYSYCKDRNFIEQWRKLKPKTAEKRKIAYRKLINRHGKNYHNLVDKRIKLTWSDCLKR